MGWNAEDTHATHRKKTKMNCQLIVVLLNNVGGRASCLRRYSN